MFSDQKNKQHNVPSQTHTNTSELLLFLHLPSNWTLRGPWKELGPWHLNVIGGKMDKQKFQGPIWNMKCDTSLHCLSVFRQVPCWSMSLMRAFASQQFSWITLNSFPSFVIVASPCSRRAVLLHWVPSLWYPLSYHAQASAAAYMARARLPGPTGELCTKVPGTIKQLHNCASQCIVCRVIRVEHKCAYLAVVMELDKPIITIPLKHKWDGIILTQCIQTCTYLCVHEITSEFFT